MKKRVSDFRISRRAVFYFFLFPAIFAAFIWQTCIFAADAFGSENASTNSRHHHSGNYPERPVEQNNAPADLTVFDEFNQWAARHLNSDFSDAARHYETGERLAAERRRILKELIQSDPEAALERAISREIYNRLPAVASRHLEKRIGARGDFLVAVADEIDTKTGELVSHQTMREAVFGETRYRAFVYGRRAAMTSKFGIPLRGIVLDDLMAVDENGWRKIEPQEYLERGIDAARLGENGVAAEVGERVVYFGDERQFDEYVRDLIDWEMKIAPVRQFDSSGGALSPWTEGAKTLLYIRVDFPDRQGEPVDSQNAPLTAARAQSVMDGGVNPFYVSNSYSKTSVQTTVTPVVRMPQAQSFYTVSNLSVFYADARAAARAAGLETDNYNFDLIAFSSSPNFGFAGAANIGAKGFILNGAFDFKTTAHELGHCYGLVHANLWRTNDGTVTGSGSNVEYGDGFDMMGGGASQITHFNAGYKRALDWLTETNVQTVTQSGTYRIFAYDATAAPAGKHLLKIRKDAAKNYLLEFRQLITGAPALMNGAVLRWDFPFVEGNRRQTQLLDMTPATPSIADAPITVGQTFTDNASGVSITVLGKGGTTPESLDIKVELNFAIINGAAFDFDGDNKSDIGVFRPAEGAWYLNRSSQGFGGVNWGLAGDRIVPAKFNLDRSTDIAVFRDGTWYVHNPFGSPLVRQFGQAGDIPVPADYDGDGAAEMAVYRPSDGTWYMWNWILQRFTAVQFGISTDKPVPADYDGDGRTDVAVFRPENGYWYLLRSTQGFTAVQFGISEDKPVAADYDGDAKADVAVFRPSSGVWYRLGSATGFSGTQFGVSTDLPAPADFDGDGKTDLAVYRNGDWYLLRSAQGFAAFGFGVSSDRPVSNAFVP
ncbi:MAG TPA: FG-GAP-like repeat-containing protein [Pyrinomonadaceae bacterium]|nr:FG-GAP-like repeat-containing protein [Pyrinomonadaceae bacterium]